MYLLHREGSELKLTEFVGTIPAYAILSHTWGEGEVTFKEMYKGKGTSKAGFKKIEFCMARAIVDGLQYCWVDTCCIDKTNNNEVTEAINSMFRWYQEAAKCYVYLPDVPQGSFLSSRWFTRGWTLQELLAPKIVEFFTSTSERLGDKISLLQDIHKRTLIPVAALQGQGLETFSVDERMLWIKDRHTKREEDMVYSMLGIFGVSMPLVYGERRQRALYRLYQQITESPAYTEFTHRVMSRTDTGQVEKIERIGALPECVQQVPGQYPRALAREQNSISQPACHQTNVVDHCKPDVECQIVPRKPQYQNQYVDVIDDWRPAFQCETCEKTFGQQNAVTQHMDATGHWEPREVCETCEKKFHSRTAAIQHMDATGHWEPKFECETCDKKFHSRAAATQHMDATSHREPKFQCETCDKKFQSQIAANQHMVATNHWKPKFKCETCEKMFHSQVAAKQHIYATNHWAPTQKQEPSSLPIILRQSFGRGRS